MMNLILCNIDLANGIKDYEAGWTTRTGNLFYLIKFPEDYLDCYSTLLFEIIALKMFETNFFIFFQYILFFPTVS